ncbi:Ppx/GppA phosphatase family protein [Halobacteriovorax marinus]|uniref:Ppx/GppA phosphatase family protein n=1 Tax=Halobacteriovorax marinus TaxID=97084 RepID=UPI003A92BD79
MSIKSKHIYLILSFVILGLSSSCSSVVKKESCLVKRAAFDIGSGSTKMTLAKVNKCENKIVEVFFEDQSAVAYKQSLYDNGNKFSDKVIREGISELKELKETAIELGVTEFSALATQAFREASNGADTLEKISKQSGINIRVINQELEAKFGYLGAKIKHPFTDDEDILIWDIGGGSMQMTFVEDGKYFHYLGNLASVSFKETVLKSLFKNKKRTSPNPLGKLNAKKATALAKFFAKANVPSNVKEYLKKARVFGIGGVHYHSLRNQALKKGHIYNQTQLRVALNKRARLSDRSIGGKYASTDVTNIALVLGYMSALQIRKVETLNVNMSHGLFLDNESW